MHSCNNCPKRDSCKSICTEVEKLLPPEDGGTDSELSLIDREIAWSVQDIEADLPERYRLIARLYHRYGLKQEVIGRILRRDRSRISRILRNIRRIAARK